MHLLALHLENFRGFERLDLTFEPDVTVLIGGNGAGKSAVLEAIKVAFGSFFASIPQVADQAIEAEQVRRVVYDLNGVLDLQEQWPVTVGALLDVEGEDETGLLPGISLEWQRQRSGRGGRTQWSGDTEMRDWAARLHQRVQRGELVRLPLFAFYGTGRLWKQKRITSASRGIGTRFDGYSAWHDIASSEQLLTDWMYGQRLVELEAREHDPTASEPRLSAVTRAVCDCIEGVTRFWVDFKRQEIQLERNGAVESFAMLSDGYRNMVAMVADIAQRAATLNPHLGSAAARETAGIVLIDEIELHLHPGWQRTVIPSLRRAFPRLQFIATTHSPQVVSTLRREQVRLLDNNRLVDAALFVEGRATNELLTDVFGVPERPPEMERELEALFRLLDQEAYAPARAKLAELEARLGRDDAAITRARWILDTEDRAGEGHPALS